MNKVLFYLIPRLDFTLTPVARTVYHAPKIKIHSLSISFQLKRVTTAIRKLQSNGKIQTIMTPFGGRNAVVVLMVCTWLGLQYSAVVGETGNLM